jgi:hypothetical protein
MKKGNEKGKRKGMMMFLTSDMINLQKVGEVIKKEKEREKEEREKRRIKCWECGREGLLSIAHIRKYTYVYCVHSRGERCYLGSLDKIFVDLLFGIKKVSEEKEREEQEGGEKE